MCDVTLINVHSLLCGMISVSTCDKLIRSIVFMGVTNRPIPIYQNLYWAARLRGMKQKKSVLRLVMNNLFILFYSPKPRSQVWFLIYRKWSNLLPCFFNFPVPRALGPKLKGRPEKLCYFIGCNCQSRASHLGECKVQVAADSCHVDAFRRSLKYFFGIKNLPFSFPRTFLSQQCHKWLLRCDTLRPSRNF